MELKKYAASLDGAIVVNKYSSFLNLILGCAVLLTLFISGNKEEKITFQPVTLGSDAWVTQSKGSQSYMESWGLYLAQLQGNITPKNIDFIIERLKPIMSPKVYTDMVDDMNIQAKNIKDDRVTIRFEPESVLYEPETNRVFVTGQMFQKSGGADERKSVRTFEYEIKIRNYAPVINFSTNYVGNPKTMNELAKDDEKAKKDNAK